MRWRVVVLVVLGVLMAAAAAVCLGQSGALTYASQQVFVSSEPTPTQTEMDQSLRLGQTAFVLGTLATPLATGTILCLIAVLIVLARRWQLRRLRSV